MKLTPLPHTHCVMNHGDGRSGHQTQVDTRNHQALRGTPPEHCH